MLYELPAKVFIYAQNLHLLDFYFNLCDEEEFSLRPICSSIATNNPKKKRTIRLFGHDGKKSVPPTTCTEQLPEQSVWALVTSSLTVLGTPRSLLSLVGIFTLSKTPSVSVF